MSCSRTQQSDAGENGSLCWVFYYSYALAFIYVSLFASAIITLPQGDTD